MNFYPTNRNELKAAYVRNNKKGNMKHERTIEIPKFIHNPFDTRTCMTAVIQV